MKNSLMMIAVLLFAAVFSTANTGPGPGEEERQLWELIKNTKDIQELDVYLETYPKGTWVKKAREKKWTIVKSEQSIKQIEAYVRRHPKSPYLTDAEDTIWQLVKNQESIPVFQDYIKNYPRSRYRKEAETQILRIEEKNKWQVVKKTNTIDQLRRYIRKNPNSRFVNEAENMLWFLVKNSNDIELLNEFIQNFPGTRHAYLAEEVIWKTVEAINSIEVLQDFLRQSPDNRFRGLAKVKLIRLQKRAETLQLSETLILDQITRLIWQRNDLGRAPWEEAKRICSKSRLHDWDDWRLPLKDELRSLFNIKHLLPDFTFTNYWTSVTYQKDEFGAWMVEYKLPLGNVDYKKHRHHVLCVRDSE